MYDLYVPTEELACPRCAAPLLEWQGKGGPCALFVWVQGRKHAVEQRGDDPQAKLSEEERERFVLPESFEIYSHDCERHGPVLAECLAPSGVWSETTIAPQ